MRDWVAANITLRKGFPGAKPPEFTHWVLDVLNAQPGDTVDDLFPGSGMVSEVIRARLEPRPALTDLFAIGGAV